MPKQCGRENTHQSPFTVLLSNDWVMMTFLSEHSTLTESLGEVTDMRSDMGDWNQVIVSLILNTPSYLFTIKSDNWVTEAKKKKMSL